jgi:hypothetical protein
VGVKGRKSKMCSSRRMKHADRQAYMHTYTHTHTHTCTPCPPPPHTQIHIKDQKRQMKSNTLQEWRKFDFVNGTKIHLDCNNDTSISFYHSILDIINMINAWIIICIGYMYCITDLKYKRMSTQKGILSM